MPQPIDGLAFAVRSGAHATGDRFVIRAASAFAGGLRALQVSPDRIATALPVTAENGANNAGDLRAAGLVIRTTRAAATAGGILDGKAGDVVAQFDRQRHARLCLQRVAIEGVARFGQRGTTTVEGAENAVLRKAGGCTQDRHIHPALAIVQSCKTDQSGMIAGDNPARALFDGGSDCLGEWIAILA
jgi:hypothetical protein